jgi:hypothetical protein
MEIKKYEIFESTANPTKGNSKGMVGVRVPQPSKEPGKVNETPTERKVVEKPKTEKPTEAKNESVKSFDQYFKINEDGVATSTLGNTGGMGAVVAPQPSSIPGDVAGSTPGSGDLPAYDNGKNFDTNPFKKKKKKSKPTKENRHLGKSDTDMYVTKFSDWLKGPNLTTENSTGWAGEEKTGWGGEERIPDVDTEERIPEADLEDDNSDDRTIKKYKNF